MEDRFPLKGSAGWFHFWRTRGFSPLSLSLRENGGRKLSHPSFHPQGVVCDSDKVMGQSHLQLRGGPCEVPCCHQWTRGFASRGESWGRQRREARKRPVGGHESEPAKGAPDENYTQRPKESRRGELIQKRKRTNKNILSRLQWNTVSISQAPHAM